VSTRLLLLPMDNTSRPGGYDGNIFLCDTGNSFS
jgi:hypothetical protein